MTNLYNQEMREYIVTEHNAELINKDQPSTEDVIEMTVALDSGAVDHVLATDHLPSSAEICELTGSRVGKSFVAANGQAMQTFGECTLECLD